MRRARRLARRLTCGASADRPDSDGPGILLDGSHVYRFGGWFDETCLPSCPAARSRRFSATVGSRGARHLARRLARGALADAKWLARQLPHG